MKYNLYSSYIWNKPNACISSVQDVPQNETNNNDDRVTDKQRREV